MVASFLFLVFKCKFPNKTSSAKMKSNRFLTQFQNNFIFIIKIKKKGFVNLIFSFKKNTLTIIAIYHHHGPVIAATPLPPPLPPPPPPPQHLTFVVPASTTNITIITIATCPSVGGRRVTRGCVLQERNTRGVATKVYLRKTSEKPEKTWSMNFKWKVRELNLRTGKVLAPHVSVTRDSSL